MEAISKVLRKNPLFTGNAEKLKELMRDTESKLRSYKSFVEMGLPDFEELVEMNANEIMLRRSVTQKFVIDEKNAPIITNLFYYFTNDTRCKWNLNAGIIFGGKVGCGKSVLMMAYLKISDEFSRKLTTSVHSKTLAALLKQSSLEDYARRPLFVDELGREEAEVKDYGNIVKPIIDLFALRYEYGARTYATTNFKYETLEKFYGEFLRTRMEEMMTYVNFPGESRRLKNEVKTK
jgi:hypothetical protein